MPARHVPAFPLVVALLVLGACDGDDHAPHEPTADGGADGSAPAADAGENPDAAADAATDGGAQTAVSLHFVARFGEQAHACGSIHGGQGSAATEVSLSSLKLYVHDLRLLTSDGEEVPLAIDERAQWQIPEIALLDLAGPRDCEPATPALPALPALPANDVVTGRVPAGDYSGVVFSVGVPHALNHDDPVTLRGPLQAPGMQWTWLTGFRFFVAEVQEVLAGDMSADAGADADAGGEQPRGAGVLHVGSVGCSGSPVRGDVRCSHPNRGRVRLDHFDPVRDAIAIDIAALFQDSDLSVESTCHSADPACEPMFEHFGLDWDTGEPLPTQQVFRVVRVGGDTP